MVPVDMGFPTGVFLGSGGRAPQVAVIDAEAALPKTLIALPAGQSVYSIATDPYGGCLVVAGTKGGTPHWLDLPAGGCADAAACRVIHGAPVLSVCFISPLQVAVSSPAVSGLAWR